MAEEDIKHTSESSENHSENLSENLSDNTSDNKENPESAPAKKKKKHLIKSAWLRIPLKILMWLIIIVLLIPVLLYVPPVQTFVKNIACKVVHNSTGMDITIDRFLLKWPLNVSLTGVTIVEASGDTMVNAREVVAAVKLRPLIESMDVQIKRLDLKDAYYRMLASDSSMLMKLRAGLLTVDDKSSANLKESKILLHKALLKDGNVSLYMDVWKKKPSNDSTSAPFYISAADLTLENFTFGMSMLPTIDTLSLTTNSLKIRNAVIDLGANRITADYLGAKAGNATYLTPPADFIASHPAPPSDTTVVASAPMVIKGDTVELAEFQALYGVKGATPLPGFDPSYLQVSGVNISLRNFYNAGSSLALPIASMTATERCGLEITEGRGTVSLDSAGITLDDLFIRTPYTTLSATAGVPFALMAMEPSAPVNVKAKGSVGIPDVEAFMPTLSSVTGKLPQRSPLNFDLSASGRLSDVAIPVFSADMPGVFSLSAKGNAANALDFKRLRAKLDFDGSVVNPAVVDGILGNIGFKMPRLHLKGTASAANQAYTADFRLQSSVGDLAADGSVSMTSEAYNAKVNLNRVNVAHFMPTLGVGLVTASLQAKGAGFNPTLPRSNTDVKLDVASVVYHKQTLRDIKAFVRLDRGVYSIVAVSDNQYADFNISGSGTLAPDLYTFDVNGILNRLDLQAIGLTPDPNGGHARLRLKGSASPDKWLYNVGLSLSNVNWQVGDMDFNIPGSVDATFRSDSAGVAASADALLTSLRFDSSVGLKHLLDRLTLASDSLTRQLKEKYIDIEHLQQTLPPFNLALNASGNGVLGKVMAPMGITTDTIYASFANDSLISGRLGTRNISNASMRADTITFNLSQRGGLLDYKLHMGNRSNNPISEFADVNLNGYVGSNRVLLSLTQKNQQGKTGYRLGLTASYADSTATVHFTPLKATIAYLPWQFNADNYIEYNTVSRHISADLMAYSNESSIRLQTQPGRSGNDELHVNLQNIHIQDFLQMSVFAPPLTANVNADLNVGYAESWLYGGGSLSVSDFNYDKIRVGDFDLGLRAGRNNDGATGAKATLKVDGTDALSASVRLEPDSTGVLEAKKVNLELTRFPLRVANAFLGRDLVSLSGFLNGDFDMKGKFSAPVLNGSLECDSVGVYVPMIGSTVMLDNDSVSVRDNIVTFKNFTLWGANDNPLTLAGTVDARKFSNMIFNLAMNGRKFQLIGNDKRSRSEIYGKLFLDLDASVKGPMNAMDINAKVNVLKNTDLFYEMSETTSQLSELQDAGGVVKFVNFNDTTQVAKVDTVAPMMAMRINAGLTVSPGARISADLNTASGKVVVNPEGTVNFFQNYMGDMRLNGQLNIMGGTASFAMATAKADFDFNPSSYIHWNGELMNPTLNVSATDHVRTNLIENGNSRFVNFIVTLLVTNDLNAPKVQFDLTTDDDMSIQNTLMSMSAEQRSMAAINLLLTGQFSSGDVKTASSDLIQSTLYEMLSSQVNNFLANHVKGVDLSIGVSQYNKTVNGETGSAMNYSYSMSKSLFDDRFKISVGGNYTTDASADENFSENLISDISFEYILKQTSNLSMYVRLFRHTGFESILEGEITETGVGFVMKRRLEKFSNLFNFLPGRRSKSPVVPLPAATAPERTDSVGQAIHESVKAERNDSVK